LLAQCTFQNRLRICTNPSDCACICPATHLCMSTYAIGEGQPNPSSSPQQSLPRSMTDFTQPVTIQQYQVQLHQQPPPPSLHDGFDDDDDDVPGYQYSGSGTLSNTRLSLTDSLMSHMPPQRSISLPINAENFKSDFTVPPSILTAQHGSFTVPAGVAAARRDTMQTSNMQPPEPISTLQAQTNPGQTPYQRVARFVGPPPVPVACTECRGRHLKCDAGTPSCGRCVADGRECTYVKSRRGWKGSRRRQHGSTSRAGSVSGSETGFGVMNDGANGGKDQTFTLLYSVLPSIVLAIAFDISFYVCAFFLPARLPQRCPSFFFSIPFLGLRTIQFRL